MLNPNCTKTDLWIVAILALLVGVLLGFVPFSIHCSSSKNAWRIYQVDRVNEWSTAEKHRIEAQ